MWPSRPDSEGETFIKIIQLPRTYDSWLGRLTSRSEIMQDKKEE